MPLAVLILAAVVGSAALVASGNFLFVEAQVTSHQFDAICNLSVFLLTGVVLLVQLFRKQNWARLLTVVTTLWAALHWLDFARLIWLADGSDYEVLGFGVAFLGTALLLLTAPVSRWFDGKLIEQSVAKWLALDYGVRVAWALFVGGITIVRWSSYGRGGNFLFGLCTAISGTVLFTVYSNRSCEFALGTETNRSIAFLAFSLAILVISIFHPAASLSLLLIVSLPLQCVWALGVLARLLAKAWAAPQISRPYLLSLIFANVLAGFGVIGLVVGGGVRMH